MNDTPHHPSQEEVMRSWQRVGEAFAHALAQTFCALNHEILTKTPSAFSAFKDTSATASQSNPFHELFTSPAAYQHFVTQVLQHLPPHQKIWSDTLKNMGYAFSAPKKEQTT